MPPLSPVDMAILSKRNNKKLTLKQIKVYPVAILISKRKKRAVDHHSSPNSTPAITNDAGVRHHMNKVLQFTLVVVSQPICVSHTSKENTVLRLSLPPENVYVIPNAADTVIFRPT